MKILIAGDLFVSDQFYNDNIIDKSVKDLFLNADFRIVNLEAPITDESSENKIIKTGPYLRMSEKTSISILNQLNIDAVTLANNHILDYGTHGLLDTFDTLEREKISFVGAGNNLVDSSKHLTIDKDGIKIAIINFCENEWSIAKEELPGANPMNLIDNSFQIREAKASHDKVIVIVHGGHEYYNLPSPRMQKQYRFYADQGADFVVGHHTHCISGNEVYNGVPIYYSLGNFLFTSQSTIEDWYTGLVLEVNIEKGNLTSQLHPVEQQKETFELSLLIGKKREDIIKRISKYNAIIEDEEKLKNEWDNYVDTKYDVYLNYWSPFSFISNRYVRGVLNRLGIKGLNKKGIVLALNLMRCEAHVDMSKEVTNKYLKG